VSSFLGSSATFSNGLISGDVFSIVYILIFYSEITFFWWSVNWSLEIFDSRYEDGLLTSWLDEDDEIVFLGIKDCFVSELLALAVCAPSLSIRGEAVDLKPNFLVDDALTFSAGLENLLKIPFF